MVMLMNLWDDIKKEVSKLISDTDETRFISSSWVFIRSANNKRARKITLTCCRCACDTLINVLENFPDHGVHIDIPSLAPGPERSQRFPTHNSVALALVPHVHHIGAALKEGEPSRRSGCTRVVLKGRSILIQPRCHTSRKIPEKCSDVNVLIDKSNGRFLISSTMSRSTSGRQ